MHGEAFNFFFKKQCRFLSSLSLPDNLCVHFNNVLFSFCSSLSALYKQSLLVISSRWHHCIYLSPFITAHFTLILLFTQYFNTWFMLVSRQCFFSKILFPNWQWAVFYLSALVRFHQICATRPCVSSVSPEFTRKRRLHLKQTVRLLSVLGVWHREAQTNVLYLFSPNPMLTILSCLFRWFL